MGGRWLRCFLKNVVDKIRLLLIYFLEGIVKKNSVKRRVSVSVGRHELGGFVDNPDDDVDLDDVDGEEVFFFEVDGEEVEEVESDEEDVNIRAEKFIADFYQHLRVERQLDLERQQLVDFNEILRLKRQIDLERQQLVDFNENLRLKRELDVEREQRL